MDLIDGLHHGNHGSLAPAAQEMSESELRRSQLLETGLDLLASSKTKKIGHGPSSSMHVYRLKWATY